MEKLRFGIVGGGKGAYIADFHLKGAVFDELGILAAGCFSRNNKKSLEFGESKNICSDRIYRTYSEMAEQESKRSDTIDFIIIAAPNNIHYDCAKIFLEHGINVVCDKPLTNYSKEAEDLMRLTRKNDLLFAVTYTHSAMPAVVFMHNLISEGRLGKIRMVKVEYLSDNLAVSNGQLGNSMLWRLDPKQAGPSTCCSDIGVHAQNLVSAVTGLKMDELSADMNIFGENRILDTNFTATVRYQSGVKGHFWCSNVAIGKSCDLNIAIYGDRGSVIWSEENAEIVIFNELSGNSIYYRMGTSFNNIGDNDIFRLPAGASEGFYVAFANIYKNFMTALLKKKAGENYIINYPDVSCGVESLKFVEACLESSQNNGQWTKVFK